MGLTFWQLSGKLHGSLIDRLHGWCDFALLTLARYCLSYRRQRTLEFQTFRTKVHRVCRVLMVKISSSPFELPSLVKRFTLILSNQIYKIHSSITYFQSLIILLPPSAAQQLRPVYSLPHPSILTNESHTQGPNRPKGLRIDLFVSVLGTDM